MAALPGLPKIPFLLLGGSLAAFAGRTSQKAISDKNLATPAAKVTAKENLETLLKVEPLAAEVGLGLVKLVEGGANSPLLRRIAGIRRQLASDLGYLLPPIRVTDNLTLKAGEYAIFLKGVEVARYELLPGCDLAIQPPGGASQSVEGVPAEEPAFGMPAVWVPPGLQKRPEERAIPWSIPSASWGRIWPKPFAPSRMSSSPVRTQRRCWIAWPRTIPRWSRIWSLNCSHCQRCRSFAEFAKGTRFNSGRRIHFGSLERGGPDHEEPHSTDGVRPTVDPANGCSALSERRRRVARISPRRFSRSGRGIRCGALRTYEPPEPSAAADPGGARSDHQGGWEHGDPGCAPDQLRFTVLRSSDRRILPPESGRPSHGEVPIGPKVMSLGLVQ